MLTRQDSVEVPIDLLFVANEGVLLTTRTKQVMIDALYDEPNPAYAAPPAEMLQAMQTGAAPFDNVDIVLLTHNHPDHYSPRLVAQFLSHSSETVFVAPVDAVEALEEVAADWPQIRERVVSLELEVGTAFDTVIDGISVAAHRTLHSGNRETPQNVMYLVELDGRTIFHEGDSDGSVDTFVALGLGDKRIDLALVHFWFPLEPNGEAIILGVLKPDHVGLFHLPLRLRADAPTTMEQVAGKYMDLFLLTSPGDRRTIPE
jgi:L-ascorbate metabolism protein UlaG (beta-lactamase superfamily)